MVSLMLITSIRILTDTPHQDLDKLSLSQERSDALLDPKDVFKIPTMDAFLNLRDKLNLTDRQRQVFVLKYSRGWRNIDIAEELGVNQDTIGEDLKIIRTKLVSIGNENLNC